MYYKEESTQRLTGVTRRYPSQFKAVLTSQIWGYWEKIEGF